MTMHPELEHALESGLTISEVIKIFAKYHSGPIGEHIDGDFTDFESVVLNDSSFWDNWKPLSLRLRRRLFWDKPNAVQDSFSSIYKGLTREIISWLCDSKRKSNVCVIAEPQRARHRIAIPTRAGIIANACYHADRLAAQPSAYVDDIIGQLAARYPPYRRVLAEKLVDNPGILELPTRTRFKKLIHEPWKALQESHPQYIAAPPVIVLHWDSGYINDEFFYSICELNSSQPSGSLLWIITIDTKFKLPIQDLIDAVVPVRYIHHSVSYDEAPVDAALILRHRFSNLRHHGRYKQMLDTDEVGCTHEVWPSDEQMSHLSRFVTGVFESIDAIIDYVDREDGGGPETHLATFLAYTIDFHSPSNERPYSALDHFYTQAFSNVPPHLLPVANLVLSIIYFGIDPRLVSPLQIACLLSVEKATVLSVHAYLSGWAIIGTKEHYDASNLFRDFFKDPKRSGQLHNPESGPFAVQAVLHFLRHSSNLLEFLKSRVQSTQVNSNAYGELQELRHTVSEICCATDTPSRQAFSEHILTHRFDFRCLVHTFVGFHAFNFMGFLYDLCKLDNVNTPNIVRVEPVGSMDRQFIDKCEGLADPWDIETRQWPSSPKYVLLGIQNETVLVLLEDAGEGHMDLRADIYTSAMLEFM